MKLVFVYKNRDLTKKDYNETPVKININCKKQRKIYCANKEKT